MIVTNEILEKGKSNNNGWSLAQLRLFRVYEMKNGWKSLIIGKDFPEDTVNEFYEIRNAHLTNGNNFVKRKKGSLKFTLCDPNIPWKDQYLHPNWQKMRLYILNRDGWTCINCRAVHQQLHVHHIKYLRGKLIWEVPTWYLVSLCDICHSEEHGRDLKAQLR